MSKNKKNRKKQNKKTIVVVVSCVAAFVLLAAGLFLGGFFTSPFRSAKTDKVELGMTQVAVKKILGNSCESQKTFDGMDSLIYYQTWSNGGKSANPYKSIICVFDDGGRLISFSYNTATIYNKNNLYASANKKTVDKFVPGKSSVCLGCSAVEAEIPYFVSYTDGSVMKAYVKNVLDWDADEEGECTATVQDVWGNYPISLNVMAKNVVVRDGFCIFGNKTAYYKVGEELTFDYTGSEDYFDGWYIGEEKVSSEPVFHYTLASESEVLYISARCKPNMHELDKNCECLRCGLICHNLVDCECTRCDYSTHVLDDSCYCSVCQKHIHELNLNCICLRCGSTCHTMVDCVCLHCGLTEHTTDENCVCTKCRQTVHTLNDNCVCKKCRTTQHTLNEHCECVVCYETIHTYDGCKCTVCGAQNHTPNDDCICIVCGESAHIVDRNCRCYNCGETHHSIDNHCYCSECDRSFHTVEDDCYCTTCKQYVHSFVGCVCSECGYTCHTPNKNCICLKCGLTAHTPDEDCVCTVCHEEAHSFFRCECRVCDYSVHELDKNCFCQNCNRYVHRYENCVCTVCNTSDHDVDCDFVCKKCHEKLTYYQQGDFICFGMYPQSVVESTDITDELNRLAGDLPKDGDAKKWTSYDYYIDGENDVEYMWYIDIKYNQDKYRGVYFTQYRPKTTQTSSSADNSYQYENGYETEQVYWFRFDPIKWAVKTADKDNNTAIMVAQLILDSRSFQDTCEERSDGDRYNDNPDIVKDVFANNYYYSTIRKWLNDTFYNTAFNKEQQEKILPTTLINDAESTNPYENTSFWNEGENRFADNEQTQEVTRDKVWFFSEYEVTDPQYVFEHAAIYDAERIKETTPYAQCQGAYRDEGGLYDQTGWYWLRSPSCFFSSSVYGVKHMGRANKSFSVFLTGGGVAPVLRVKDLQ